MSQETPLYQPPSGSLRFVFPSSDSPVKFDIKVDADLIQFAKDRARTYRVSHGLYPEWSNEGAPAKTMADLAKYWAQTYDWKAVEDRINSQFDHFATTVPGNREYDAPVRIHFVHQPSKNKDAIPLLMLHGWTSSHLEWSTVAPKLSDRFHIVAPDLPGYGFSPAPTQPGLGPREMGLAFDAVMKQLGYARYGLASTDLGGMVAAWMGADIPQSIIGHFADFLLLVPTPADIERAAKGEVTAEEGAYMATMGEWSTNHFAYASIQGQKPLAMSHSMADSPVGFAGWIWDLKHVASDGYAYSHEEIITETLMQWIQEPYASLRPYIEFLKPENFASLPRTEVPTGVTQWGNVNGPFPELAKYPIAPREWADRLVKVAYFKRHESGGHFPAVNEPENYVADIVEFFSGL